MNQPVTGPVDWKGVVSRIDHMAFMISGFKEEIIAIRKDTEHLSKEMDNLQSTNMLTRDAYGVLKESVRGLMRDVEARCGLLDEDFVCRPNTSFIVDDEAEIAEEKDSIDELEEEAERVTKKGNKKKKPEKKTEKKKSPPKKKPAKKLKKSPEREEPEEITIDLDEEKQAKSTPQTDTSTAAQ